MRFDAWNATFHNGNFEQVRELLHVELGVEFEPRRGGLHGYDHSEMLQIGGANIGITAWGGTNQRFFVEVKGEPSQRWSEIVQAWLSKHDIEDQEALVQLTRADVCWDWEDVRDVVDLAPGIRSAVEDSERRGRRLQWDQRGDWQSEEGRNRGCTLYMGSPKSPVRVRVYDKGLEQIGKGVEGVSRNWRRAEVQVKPETKVEKVTWARLGPAVFWRTSIPAQRLAEYLGIPADGKPMRVPAPQAELERLKDLASVQYGGAVIDLVRDLVKRGVTSSRMVAELSAEVHRRKARRFAA